MDINWRRSCCALKRRVCGGPGNATWSAATVSTPGTARADAVEYPHGAVGRRGPRHPGGVSGRRSARGFCWTPSTPVRREQLVTAGNFMTPWPARASRWPPAGGAFSLYANWRWTAASGGNLPEHRAGGLAGWPTRPAPGGHGVVGVTQGGTAALTLAASTPTGSATPARCRASCTRRTPFLSGAPAPRDDAVRRRRHQPDGGPAQLGRWKWHDPYVHNQQLIDNNTRLVVFSPNPDQRPAAMIGYCDQAQSNRSFYGLPLARRQQRTLRLPTGGQHDWATGPLGSARAVGRSRLRDCLTWRDKRSAPAHARTVEGGTA